MVISKQNDVLDKKSIVEKCRNYPVTMFDNTKTEELYNLKI